MFDFLSFPFYIFYNKKSPLVPSSYVWRFSITRHLGHVVWTLICMQCLGFGSEGREYLQHSSDITLIDIRSTLYIAQESVAWLIIQPLSLTI